MDRLYGRWVPYLMDEHEEDGDISSRRFGQQLKCICVVQQRISEGPVDGHGRRDGQREDVECGKQVDILELHGSIHGVHDLPAKAYQTPLISPVSINNWL